MGIKLERHRPYRAVTQQSTRSDPARHLQDHPQHALEILSSQFRVEGVPGQGKELFMGRMIVKVLENQPVAYHSLGYPRRGDFRQRDHLIQGPFAQQPVSFTVQGCIQIVLVILGRTGMMRQQALLFGAQYALGGFVRLGWKI
jgi:hypothetical protein